MSTPNVYYDPQKFGLSTVGEIEWAEPDYSFDLTVVWQRDSDGHVFYASDNGCSCPTPFDGLGVDDLSQVLTLGDLQGVLEDLDRSEEKHNSCYNPQAKTQIARILETLHTGGFR